MRNDYMTKAKWVSPTIFLLLVVCCGCSVYEKAAIEKTASSSATKNIACITPNVVPSGKIDCTPTSFEPGEAEEEELKALNSFCDAMLLDKNIRLLGLSFSEVEQSLGNVSQVIFNTWGENRIYFKQSSDYRFNFGQIIVPTEAWHTWTSEEFYDDYHWRQSVGDSMFDDNDDCNFIEISITSVFQELRDQPTMFPSSMIERIAELDQSSPEEFLTWIDEVEQRGRSNFEGLYFSEYEYEDYIFRFVWLNSDGSFSDKSWCLIYKPHL